MNRGKVPNRVFLSFLIMLLMMVTVGCSKSDDAPAAAGSTISGVAAAGAPIIGTVTIKDSTTPTPIERVSTIAADGSYSINVSGMTAPFALRADGYVGGREYHLYSAAVSTDINGKINITPFTDLIIANMAADIAENYYNGDAFSGMTAEDLAAAETALQAKLQAVLTALGVEAGIDLLRTSFNTDHTGLDAVIDIIKVTVDPDTVEATLTNVVNNESITVDIGDGGTATGTLTDDGVATGITALQAINTTWTTFCSLFATGLPSASNATLQSLIADPFLESGVDRDSWLTKITTGSDMIGISLISLNLLSLDEVAGTAKVQINISQGGQTGQGPDSGYCLMVKQDDGTGTMRWRYAGDGRIARANVKVEAAYYPYNSSNRIQTGLNVQIEANYPAGAAVKSAVVTGSGITGSLILNKTIEDDWFHIEGGINDGSNFYTDMSASTIDSIPDNAEYTIVLKDGASGTGSTLATYTSTILKRPLKLTELSSASFPVITAPSQTTLEAFSSGSLTVTWTMPTGLMPQWVYLQVWDSGSNSDSVEDNSLSSTTTSTTLTLTPSFTVTGRWLGLCATDVYNRRFQTNIW